MMVAKMIGRETMEKRWVCLDDGPDSGGIWYFCSDCASKKFKGELIGSTCEDAYFVHVQDMSSFTECDECQRTIEDERE